MLLKISKSFSTSIDLGSSFTAFGMPDLLSSAEGPKCPSVCISSSNCCFLDFEKHHAITLPVKINQDEIASTPLPEPRSGKRTLAESGSARAERGGADNEEESQRKRKQPASGTANKERQANHTKKEQKTQQEQKREAEEEDVTVVGSKTTAQRRASGWERAQRNGDVVDFTQEPDERLSVDANTSVQIQAAASGWERARRSGNLVDLT